MLVKLFPLDERLLDGYIKPDFSDDEKKGFVVIPIFMLIISLLFIIIGEDPKADKIVYFSPVLFMNAVSFILLFSRNERRFFIGEILSVFSISSFVLAICILLSDFGIGLQNACLQMAISMMVYLIILVIGYRLHFKYQMEHGPNVKGIPWSSTTSGMLALSGVILAKFVSVSMMSLICGIVWIVLHVIVSVGILEDRKYVIYTKRYN